MLYLNSISLCTDIFFLYRYSLKEFKMIEDAFSPTIYIQCHNNIFSCTIFNHRKKKQTIQESRGDSTFNTFYTFLNNSFSR